MKNELFISLDEFTQAEKYWLEKLSGQPGEVRFAVHVPEQNQGVEAKYDKYNIELEDRQVERLIKISKSNNLSLFIFLLTVFKILLYRYTEQTDIIVTTPIINNTNREFNRYVFLRNRVYPQYSFKELLIDVRNTVVEGYKNEHYPLHRLLDQLEIKDRSLFSRNILVLEGLHLWEHSLAVETGENDIIFYFRGDRHRQNRMTAEITYHAGLFTPNHIRDLANRYRYILDQVLNDLEIPVSSVKFLTEEEKNRILYELNQGETVTGIHKTLHRLFQEQVDRTPDHVALVGITPNSEPRTPRQEGTGGLAPLHITYRELNEKSDQLARQLQGKGVQADHIVGLILQDPLLVTIGMLGTLKAGGAYLPLDPLSPGNMKTYILADSNVSVLLTSTKLENKVKAGVEDNLKKTPGPSLQFINLETNLEYALEHSPSNLTSTSISGKVGPANLAYIIYTSGSTGRPKAVPVEHKSIVNYALWRNRHFHYTREDMTLQLVSYSFDGFGSNFYSSLLSGGTLFMLDNTHRRDLTDVADIMKKECITNISLVPGMYNPILDNIETGAVPYLRFIVLAGEVALPALIARSKQKIPSAVLANEYGPTETTVTAVSHWNMTKENTSIIGRPINNIKIYILDGFFNPVPIEVPGQLYIAGQGVARGYLNQPELTAERFKRAVISHSSLVIRNSHKFFPNDQCPMTNDRSSQSPIYQTGDRARWLPDGNIQFLGRADHQVKIRGFRIEVEEIENRIVNYQGIKEAVVIARKEENRENSEKYLCAYFISNPGISIPRLKEYLSGELPEYMVPSYFIPMEKMPLTPGGKVDRKALLELEHKTGKEKIHIPPRTEWEKKLAKIWSEVLVISEETIGSRDDFIRLGGHSVRAMVLVSRLLKEFSVKLQLPDVLNYSTLAGQAAYIEKMSGMAAAAVEPGEKKEYYPVTPGQKRLYFIQEREPTNIVYNVSHLHFFSQPPGEVRLMETFNRLIQRHEILRTYFKKVGEEPIQIIHPQGELETRYNEAPEADLPRVFVDFCQPFHPGTLPLFRSRLVHVTDKQTVVLMLDLHHIICDGISLGILLKEFQALMEGNRLPPMKLQYKDYAVWQQRQIETQALKKHEDYWLKIFKGDIPLLHMPTDFPRPKEQSFAGGSVYFEIGVEETRELEKMAVDHGVTLFILFLAIYNVFLSRLCHREDIIIGASGDARCHPHLEEIVGMFYNTLALRNEPKGELTFAEFLEDVNKKALEAFAHQNYPLEDLADKKVKHKDASRNPLFDVFYLMAKKETPRHPCSRNNEYAERKEREIKTYKELNLEQAAFDFILSIVAEKDIRFIFYYSTKLFKPQTIEKYRDYFLNIVRKIKENPGIQLKRLDLAAGKKNEK
jgi:amino acid adenylation domain-containing protein